MVYSAYNGKILTSQQNTELNLAYMKGFANLNMKNAEDKTIFNPQWELNPNNDSNSLDELETVRENSQIFRE